MQPTKASCHFGSSAVTKYLAADERKLCGGQGFGDFGIAAGGHSAITAAMVDQTSVESKDAHPVHWGSTPHASPHTSRAAVF